MTTTTKPARKRAQSTEDNIRRTAMRWAQEATYDLKLMREAFAADEFKTKHPRVSPFYVEAIDAALAEKKQRHDTN